jgi:hypothetical protein
MALLGMYRSVKRGKGRETGYTGRMLRGRTYLLSGIPYFIVCTLLWKSLPIAFFSHPINVYSVVLASIL